MHALAALIFVPVFLATPVNGPSGGDKIGMVITFGLFSFAFLLLGLGTSLFAPGWRRKLLLHAANVLPCAWIFVELPPWALVELVLILLFALFGQNYLDYR